MAGAHGGAEALSDADVVDALRRVLEGADFRNAPRSRDFLAYVVTETLAGRGDQLSERTVGRRALDRGPDFDGRDSATVRVQANRVRSALQRYYAGAGADDPVRIELLVGGYAPRFRRVDGVDGPGGSVVSPTLRTGVVVLELEPFAGSQDRVLARTLTESLVHRLAAHPTIVVVGPTRAATDDAEGLTRWGVATVLAGQVRTDAAAVRLRVRLTSARTGEVLWSQDRTIDRAELAADDPEDTWAREVAALLGDPSGPVVRHEIGTRHGTTEPELAARLAFFSYVDRGTEESIHAAIAALDEALATTGRTPTLLAMRGALANASAIYGTADAEACLDLAEALAREALALDASHVHAHLVLGSAARDRRQFDLALTHAARARELAPYHPSFLVGAGITMSGCGEWEAGAALIDEAFRLHPGLPGHSRAWVALGHLVRGDHAAALVEASVLPVDGGYVWGPLYRAMALAGLGHLDRAGAEHDRAARMRPDVLDDPRAYFHGRMRCSDDELDHLVHLVELASADPVGAASVPGLG
jgi:TolB-like protein/Flp pilus assembly protein TadD